MQHRADIDGLRGVAVMMVIAYHFQGLIPGGYMGVDIFIVLSGYVISSALHKYSGSLRHLLLDFYTRRANRLLPAALVMNLFTLAAGYFLLGPRDYIKLSRASDANVLLYSNLWHLQASDYFAGSSDYLPLLHTWSLAVEEQFYILFPILFILLTRKAGITAALLTLSCVLMGSVIWALVVTADSPASAFYQIQYRACEFLAGSCAYLLQSIRVRRNELRLSPLALVAILSVVLIPNEPQTYPSQYTLYVVLATAYVLRTGGIKGSITHMALTHWTLRAIGSASYSAYLWHWPIISFSRHLEAQGEKPAPLLVASVAALASFASWRYIENPWRNITKHSPKWRRRGLIAIGFGICLSVSLSKTIRSSEGASDRFTSSAILRVNSEAAWMQDSAFTDPGKPSLQLFRLNNHDVGPTESVDIIFWGDSHARQLFAEIKDLAQQLNLHCIGIAKGGHPPLLGVDRRNKPGNQTAEHSAAAIQFIYEKRPRFVALAAFWANYASSHETAWLSDKPQATSSAAESASVLRSSLLQTLEAIRAAGSHPIIIDQLPTLTFDPVPRAEGYYLFSRGLPPESWNVVLPDPTVIRTLWKDLPGVPPPISEALVNLAPSQHMYQVIGNETGLYWRDATHLSRHGVRILLGAQLRNLLARI